MSLVPTQASSSGAPTENLAGLVERVTFHNVENGFCVLRLKAHGQREVAAAIASIADRARGLQFRQFLLQLISPTTAEGIERHLGPGTTRGAHPPSRPHASLRRRDGAGRPSRFQATRCASASKGACYTMLEHPGSA